jgi:DNA-binding LacI/PurR family transcriptional regulator
MPSVLQNDKSVSQLKGTSERVISAAREPNYVRFALCRSISGTNTKIVIFSV